MENLVLHIEYLLLRHDCVIIPGFGAFINAFKPARYDSAAGVWFPSEKEIRFNASVNTDDGLLANSYARRMQIPFGEARTLLENDIRSLRTALDNENEISFGKIGIVRYSDGVLNFSPLRSATSLNSELGLIPVNINDITDSTPAVDVDEVLDIPRLHETETESNIQTSKERKLNFNKNYYIPINKRFARAIASSLLIAILTLPLLLTTSDKDSHKIDKAGIAPLAQMEALIDSTVKNQKCDSASQQAETQVDPKAPTAVSYIADKTESQLKYFLIVATFANEKDAASYIQSEHNKGYELILLPTTTLCRVAAKGSADKNELVNILNSPEFKSDFSGGWIWTAK